LRHHVSIDQLVLALRYCWPDNTYKTLARTPATKGHALEDHEVGFPVCSVSYVALGLLHAQQPLNGFDELVKGSSRTLIIDGAIQ
jgi:hypothetical protein